MRAAQIDQSGAVINFAEVEGYSASFIDPQNSVVGSVWNGTSFTNPAPVPSPIPEVISPRQFRQSLTYYTFRTNVENAVAASDQNTKDWYQYAPQFERHHPEVLAMAQQLGYTSAQLDEVWTYGATL